LGKKLTRPSARSTLTHESAGVQMKKRRQKLPIRMPGQRAFAKVHGIHCIEIIFDHVCINKKIYLFDWFMSWVLEAGK